eukprot:SRR837773.12678.p1 GENE.SRR837773.12678~~SRR837773.12678.p1  ORF type:complete len:212 (-),score=57.79 SRR837773.12678:55-600(-)
MYGATADPLSKEACDVFDTSDLLAAANAEPNSVKGIASAVLLQLLLWAGAWGLVDTLVWMAAPNKPAVRLVLYGLVATVGVSLLLPLLRLQQQRDVSPAKGGRDEAHALSMAVVGFPVTIALATGFWGVVDSAVEVICGETQLAQSRGYMFIMIMSCFGIALHHRWWPHQVISNLGQVSLV